ncbi:MAG: hypothetical protein ACXVHX_28780 [Solirubrobacteraceae bacterium]
MIPINAEADARLAALMDCEGCAYVERTSYGLRPVVQFRQTSSDLLLTEVGDAMGVRPDYARGKCKVDSAVLIEPLLATIIPYTCAHHEQFEIVHEFSARVLRNGRRRLTAGERAWRTRAANRVHTLNHSPAPGRTLRLPDRRVALSWAAAVVDSEGHLTLTGLKGFWNDPTNLEAVRAMQPRIEVSNTNKKMIVVVERVLRGGGIYVHRPPARRPCWTWSVSSPMTTVGVLDDVIPYLRAKQPEGRALRTYASLMMADNANLKTRERRPDSSLERRRDAALALLAAKEVVRLRRAGAEPGPSRSLEG